MIEMTLSSRHRIRNSSPVAVGRFLSILAGKQLLQFETYVYGLYLCNVHYPEFQSLNLFSFNSSAFFTLSCYNLCYRS